ncbi:MAG TPA: glycoside hydrolase family 2 TIM barrel-domain containing protein, partial [Bacteroidales bacterium]|nr:glycoside hydrolase family 2 TIM barrel-domain containing protein [Bacteroidales bacterium]
MKKPFVLLLTAILFAFTACVDEKKPEWSPAPNPLMTRWAASVDPAGPWPEYPRPQMQREEWMNLNGLWDYQLVRKGSEQGLYAGKILVPYPVESALSGIADSVGPGDMIFYRRYFEIPRGWTDKKILLHFEAVDWETRVYINGNEVGSHRGGYDPFSFDISQYLNEGENEITVEVSDPTNEGYQPRGKQVLTPGGILYTPSSGIWQTVWIEPVPQTFVSDIKITPDIDNAKAIFDISVASPGPGDQIHIRVLDQGKVVSEGSTNGGTHIIIPVNNPKPWSPSDPFLYDLEISVNRDGKLLDKISSYFGMRKIEKKSGPDGFVRLYLNGEALFHNGPLDQGFWPDGLYTPPTDEAMKFDVEMTKKMGFNMLRKHVKVENRRFYYWCDKLGIMVWQDMPSTSGYVAPDKADLDRPEEEREQFTMELEHLIMTRYNHPSIVMWVPF